MPWHIKEEGGSKEDNRNSKIANYLRNIRVEELESIMPPGGVTIIERE